MNVRSLAAPLCLIAVLPTVCFASPVVSDYGLLNYEGNVFPDDDTPGWTAMNTGGSREIVNGDIFKIDTLTDNTGELHRYNTNGTYPDDTLDRSGDGYVVEVRLALDTETSIAQRNTTTAAFGILIRDISSAETTETTTAPELYTIGIDETSIVLGTASGEIVQSVTLNNYTPGDQNLFSIVRVGDTLTLYHNESEVLNVSEFSGSSGGEAIQGPYIEFGDRSTGFDGIYEVDFLRAGSLVPEPASIGLFGVSALLLTARSRCRRSHCAVGPR